MTAPASPPTAHSRSSGTPVRVESVAVIDAPIERVWAITVDVEQLPRHTTTMTSVELLEQGGLCVGSTARIKQPGQRSKIWTVTVFEPTTRFAWATTLSSTVMTATHTLAPDGNATINTLTIEITGALSRIIGVLMRRPIQRAIDTENRGIKAAAEAAESGHR